MKNLYIEKIAPTLAEKICHQLIISLPEWFAIPEANERYVKGCLERVSFAARIDNEYVGMIVLEFPFPNNANIFWMGIDKYHHGCGIGNQLLQEAENYCHDKNVLTLTVETLSPKQKDINYLKTYQFYEKQDFRPLFELQPYGPDLLMCYMLKAFSYKNMEKVKHKKVQCLIRKPTQDDIKQMVTLSDDKRRQYEKAQPQFWKCAKDANKNQRKWLEQLLGKDSYLMLVSELDSGLNGFIIGNLINAPEVYEPGGLTLMIDDFCVKHPSLWNTIGRELIDEIKAEAKQREATQILVVCGYHDEVKRQFLRSMKLSPASEWYVGSI